MAALFRREPSRWRSRQFSERLSCPPTNHFANGAFQASTFFHGFRQISSFASRAQKVSGLRTDSRYIFRYSASDLIRAFFAKSFAGLKTRFSIKCDSMFVSIRVPNIAGDPAGQAGRVEG